MSLNGIRSRLDTVESRLDSHLGVKEHKPAMEEQMRYWRSTSKDFENQRNESVDELNRTKKRLEDALEQVSRLENKAKITELERNSDETCAKMVLKNCTYWADRAQQAEAKLGDPVEPEKKPHMSQKEWSDTVTYWRNRALENEAQLGECQGGSP